MASRLGAQFWLASAFLAALGIAVALASYASRVAYRQALFASVAFVAGPVRPPVRFPLAVAPNGRHLVDAAGQPFLVQGDAAWSLIANLTREEVDRYLADRRARGFNTLLVSLIEHRFADQAPANRYGDGPFIKTGDFSTPNEAYFAYADWVLRRAREEGFLVLLTPAYLGYAGGGEGWYQEMRASNDAALRGYGRYVGRRYGTLGNIIWVEGGDFNPPDRAPTRAVADGIREADPDALHTAHAAPGSAAADTWGEEPWLGINNIYTSKNVCPDALRQYARARVQPFFLIESSYENEHNSSEASLRAQAYAALLCGAAGQVFGNSPIWHFGGKKPADVPMPWQTALGSRGSQSMAHLANLLAAIPWWKLEPDRSRRRLVAEAGTGAAGIVCAVTSDGSLAVIYMPDARALTLDLSALAGDRVEGRWFDPSNGEFEPVVPQSVPVAAGRHTFAPPRALNAHGYKDRVLVLRSN
jgi:hypothetical protein